MKINIKFLEPINNNSFAPTQLYDEFGGQICRLHFDVGELFKLRKKSPQIALDFLLVGNIIYSLDRYVLRKSAPDAWTRQFSIKIPVSDVEKWRNVQPTLEKCLSFLTGDIWDLDFEQRTIDLLLIEQESLTMSPVFKAVSLFSGGLDSLVGVIDWLEENQNDSLLLVGHHDPRIAGPYGDQTGTLSVLNRYYGNRIFPIFPAVGADKGSETTLRSRSFLFVSLAIYFASQISTELPLLLPENGMMALNPPLTPSRSGSCSTRTVHPHFLSLLISILSDLGLNHVLENPLAFKTKGEALAQCKNRDVLTEAAQYTTSCAKRGHKRTWIRRTAKQCGRCIPCIYRRASLHQIGMDDEVYGVDLCKGEIDIKADITAAEDIRAYLAFLKLNSSQNALSELLVSNGKIESYNLNRYANLIMRAANEVRMLIKDKAIDEIKREAGL